MDTVIRSIYLNSKLNSDLFQQSSSKKVLIGKQKWLFYTQDNVIEDYRGLFPFSDAELAQWKNTLEQRKKWLAEQGIAYQCIIAPNKTSIYPEYLPDAVIKFRYKTPLDQLVDYLSKNSSVQILDLRAKLSTQKKKGLLYYKTDTHWNERGAFIAYRAIIDQLRTFFPQLKAIEVHDLELGAQSYFSGDLASMLGLQNDYFEERPLYRLRRIQAHRVGSEPKGFSQAPFTMVTKNQNNPRAIVFRDSFASALVPFLSENFSSITYFWQRWDKSVPIVQIIEKEKPDIVLEEIVERFIRNMDVVSNGFSGIPLSSYTQTTPLAITEHWQLEDFIPLNDVTISEKNQTVHVNATGNDPFFLLKYPVETGKDLRLNIEMRSPSATKFQIFYQTKEEREYSEKNSLSFATNAGINRISVVLPSKNIIGYIRIDPGLEQGDYEFYALEINQK